MVAKTPARHFPLTFAGGEFCSKGQGTESSCKSLLMRKTLMLFAKIPVVIVF